MGTLTLNKTENIKPAIIEAFKIAEGSCNITAWTARAKLGKAGQQEMQMLNAFLKKHDLSVDEYLESVSIK